jgi:hypothetical protein
VAPPNGPTNPSMVRLSRGRAIVNYQHMHPVSEDMTAAAMRWAKRVPALFGSPPAQAA